MCGNFQKFANLLTRTFLFFQVHVFTNRLIDLEFHLLKITQIHYPLLVKISLL